MLIVHHHYGVTGNMKVNVCNFAKLGYTTIVPDLYKMLGESDGVHEAQKKTTDGQFVEIINKAWRYLTTRPEVDANAARSLDTAWAGASASTLSPLPQRSRIRRLLSIGARGRAEPIAAAPSQ